MTPGRAHGAPSPALRIASGPRKTKALALLAGVFGGILFGGFLAVQTAFAEKSVDAQLKGETNAPADAQPAADRLAGHGGPVKGIAVHLDAGAGKPMALTASFDNGVGFWDGETGERVLWLEGHDAAVNTVAFTPNGAAAVSGSDDFSVRYWSIQSGLSFKLDGHRGKVAEVAVSPDGTMAASASWDGSVGLWRLPQSREEQPKSLGFLTGHNGAVNAVVFSADGKTLLSGSADGTVKRWSLENGSLLRTEVEHGFSVNVLLLAPVSEDPSVRRWLAYGAADGVVRVVDLESGAELAALTGDRRPILALALSPAGDRLAYGDGQGFITTVKVPQSEEEDWMTERDFRAAARGPIWALAWLDDDRLLAAGLDDSVAIWPVTGEAPALLAEEVARFHVNPETVSNGERQFARKCSVCHAVTEDAGRRAGPSLYKLFGRKIGTAPGYRYSPELVEMDITWNAETIDKLFDLGPDVYTPGSKMPVQRINKEQDRADLIAYLKAATAPRGPHAGKEAGEAARQ